MPPMKQDLFNEVPVTWEEVRAWVRAVPKLDPDTAFAEYYIKAWNVPDKIRRAKMNGTYDELVGGQEGLNREQLRPRH